MPLLEAFLALALTLLSLAMIATLIVEMIHRIAGTRSENLKVMLGELYDRELSDRDPKKMIESLLKQSGEKLDNESKLEEIVKELLKKGSKELKKNKSKLKEMVEKLLKEGSEKLDDDQSKLKDSVEADLKKNDFINGLICNPLKKGETGGRFRNGLGGFLDWLGIKGPTNRKNLASISTKDLFEKLAYTDVGKGIKAETEQEIDEKVDQLARSYDEIGVAATDLFKRKAQIVSLFAGVLVAFLFNANALSILEAYLDDPQVRAKAVAQADAALENFTRRTDIPKGFENKQELEDHVNSIKDEIEGLGNMGITIGYSSGRVPPSWPGKLKLGWLRGIVFWALGVFATGLLIGLGGPFWFNVVRKLTDVLQVVRGGAAAAAEPGDSARGPADPIKSNRDTFKTAGGPPPLVEAQAKLAAANKAAKDADKAAKDADKAAKDAGKAATDAGKVVRAAADALRGTRKAAGKNPNELMKTAIANAEEALKNATDAQKKAHELKDKTEPSVPEAD